MQNSQIVIHARPDPDVYGIPGGAGHTSTKRRGGGDHVCCRADETLAVGLSTNERMLSVESRRNPLLGQSEGVCIVGVTTGMVADVDGTRLLENLLLGINPGQRSQWAVPSQINNG